MVRCARFVVSFVFSVVAVAGLVLVTAAIAARPSAPASAPAPAAAPKHRLPPSPGGNLTIGLCDGETAIEVKGVKEGSTLEAGQAHAVADALMAEWRRKNPHASWDGTMLVAQAPGAAKSAAGKPVASKGTDTPPAPGSVSTVGETSSVGARGAPGAEAAHTQAGDTYGNYSDRDRMIWAASMESFVLRGKQVFHNVKELGGTTGISCDMCHPDGANTHPETYPKYQVQLGRVALLRDMINWCIENPVRGKALPDGDERLRALETYIYAQRRGVALDYGKH